MITNYRGLEMRRLPLIGLILLYPGWLAGQGFGTLKKTIVLERKLPAAVKLPGNSFDVKASAEKPLDLGRFATLLLHEIDPGRRGLRRRGLYRVRLSRAFPETGP
jgi:hypothetical protein